MIPYPTLEQVEAADRNQIYTWYLLLPFPRWIKDRKTKQYFIDPQGGPEIIKRIKERWEELGGYDIELAREVLHDASIGSDTAKRTDDVNSNP